MSEVTSRLHTGVSEGLSREPGERGREDHAHRHTHKQKHTRQRGALETQGNTGESARVRQPVLECRLRVSLPHTVIVWTDRENQG